MENKSVSTGLDYGRGPSPVLFRKLFLPTLLGMIFNAMITIVDGVFVGRGVGPEGISAVNIIAPLFMVTTGMGLMFGIGSSVLAGIAIASKCFDKANSIITSGFLFSTLVMVALIAVCFFFDETVARLLGCSEILMDKATDYLLFLLIGLVPLMWQSIGMMVIRLDGSPKYAMMCNVIPSVLNIILDWWFVFPLGMGVKGAAFATSISCVVGGVMSVCYFRRSYILKFTTRLTGFWTNVWREMQIGSSAFITETAMSVMMFTGNIVFMQSFGENGVAAFSIACYLFPLIFMINNAVAQSAQPLISVNYGKNDFSRVKQALKVSLCVAGCCGIIATVGIATGARQIVSAFLDTDCEAAQLAIAGLPIFATAAVFFALNIAFIGYYQSVERSMTALIFTLVRGVIVLVPMFFMLSHLYPKIGMWAAIPSTEFVTLILILLTFRL